MTARTCPRWALYLACLVSAVFVTLLYVGQSSEFVRSSVKSIGIKIQGSASVDVGGTVPAALINLVYNETDFVNEQDIIPPYWDCLLGKCNSSQIWGPCYPPHKNVNWAKQVEKYRSRPPHYQKKEPVSLDSSDLSGYCKPGFLIIGAGKCGTSSLYHYIVGHPRVLPASKKQIHYFKYFAKYPMRWYLGHFPSTESFLGSGALLTGEASPGYLPYPDVANMVARRMPGPRIIAAGREPVDRAYSSYRYNYVHPTIASLRRGKFAGIEGGRPDEEYEKNLFSFEDMIKAELQVLRECFAPNSTAIQNTRRKWGKEAWAKVEYNRRDRNGLPSLVDLDGFCYGEKVNGTVLRRQWADLVAKYPKKVIDPNNAILTQSFIGRSLYVFPLEWWYLNFRKEDIYFVCTEELSEQSGEPMNNLGQFLGLPSYNFSEIVQEGAYNVGGHKGYDKKTSWTVIDSELEAEAETETKTNVTEVQREIPLSKELLLELSDFIRPYNERLFQLTGHRCDW